ncbi:PcfB family protein [[Clostridium] fimetarium]|uniref:Ftsk gamma domain-containing protein n=1 Tax=[Clostridium] fimetarium TaxID=99656 RepID=A0A1I0M9C6_9FIRM|nr:PcfB family protein [[Clostridium] fimetarium]SEV85057.1 Ftsk gamma domain-containing protein [[Clostridium] fimetarium]
MAEEIQEAVQIIRVAYDGIEIAMKVGNGGIGAMQKAIDVLKGMLDYEKSLGKTSMKKLLMKGGDLQVLQFNTEDMKKVEKMAKKYGILYSVLPDINKKDGLSEVIFHSEAVPRANMMIQKLKFGRIATFDDYLKNGNEKDLSKLMEFLKGQKLGNEKIHTEETGRAGVLIEGLIEKVGLFAMEKQSISVDAVKENFSIGNEQAENIISQLEKIGVLEKSDLNGEHKVIMDKEAFQNRVKGYQELADRMRAISATKDTSLSDITISKKLIVDENDHAVKTRVPGAWGKYMWINKENIMEIHNGKTMLTFLDRNKDYKIYDEENRVLETVRGEKLHSTNYDKVEATIRERYEKSQSQTKTARPVKKDTVKR